MLVVFEDYSVMLYKLLPKKMKSVHKKKPLLPCLLK